MLTKEKFAEYTDRLDAMYKKYKLSPGFQILTEKAQVKAALNSYILPNCPWPNMVAIWKTDIFSKGKTGFLLSNYALYGSSFGKHSRNHSGTGFRLNLTKMGRIAACDINGRTDVKDPCFVKVTYTDSHSDTVYCGIYAEFISEFLTMIAPDISAPGTKSKPEPKLQPKPEPKPEPKPQPNPEPNPEPGPIENPGVSDSMYQSYLEALEYIKKSRYDRALTRLSRACPLTGSGAGLLPDGYVLLGDIHAHGLGTPMDVNMAADYYYVAASRKYQPAIEHFAELYNKFGGFKSIVVHETFIYLSLERLEAWKKLVGSRCPAMGKHLSELRNMSSDMVKFNCDLAIGSFNSETAKFNEYMAARARDYPSALYYLDLAIESAYNLRSRTGDSRSKDAPKALTLLRDYRSELPHSSYAIDHAESLKSYERYLEEGNIHQAMATLTRAARYGSTEAAFKLSEHYRKGDLWAKNLSYAEWFKSPFIRF